MFSNAEEAEVERFYEDLQDLLELTTPNDVLFVIGNWNAKAGSQETPGVTGKFDLGVQNKAGQRLTEFCPTPQFKTSILWHSTFFMVQLSHPFMITGKIITLTIWTKIRLIVFFVAKDGEALYSQQKEDQQLTVAHILNSLLTNSD